MVLGESVSSETKGTQRKRIENIQTWQWGGMSVIDPMMTLAISMTANPGVYAVLLGSGVSKSAGVPTGWDIVSDLCSRLTVISGDNTVGNPVNWYTSKFGREPRYDELLEAVAPEPEERRKLLNSYFVPTDEDRESRRKTPTDAHKSIAQMVRKGFVRLILTTNFDRLMESALDEAGVVDYDVVSSDEMIRGVRPYVHSPCLIIKLHGDYKDSRIKNTSQELARYSDELNQLLDRVFDEFGVIVSGWSATWDEALRLAILRAKSHRYTWYWMTLGSLSSEAEQVVRNRRAQPIEVSGADEAFNRLFEVTVSITESRQMNPLDLDVSVATAKRYLVDDRHRIRLSDLVQAETLRILETRQEISTFLNNGDIEGAAHQQSQRYIAVSSNLLGILSVTTFFGSEEAINLIPISIERLGRVERTGGYIVPLNLRRLPAQLVMYVCGLAAIGAKRLLVLNQILGKPVLRSESVEGLRPAVLELEPYATFTDNRYVPIPNAVNKYTPVSDYLANALRPFLRYCLPIDDEYEAAFDKFEILSSMIYADLVADDEWIPPGRYVWKFRFVRSLDDILKSLGLVEEEIVQSLFQGSDNRYQRAKARVSRSINSRR